MSGSSSGVAERQSLIEQRNRYRRILLEGVIPFWLKHGIDREHGGILSCLQENGALISHDKYLRSQGRAIWTFAAVHNRIAPRPDLVEIARHTAEFVLRHCFDEAGNTFNKVTRSGGKLEPATSVFTNFFFIYGLSELYRATRESRYLDAALPLFRQSAREIQQPYLDRLAPSILPPGVCWVHGPAMIAVDVGDELYVTHPSAEIEHVIDWGLRRIMEFHVRPELGTLLEYLDENNEPIDNPIGRRVVPGHGIESMWFVIHAARRRRDSAMIRAAFDVIRSMLEQGWDDEFGGLFLVRDARGGIPPDPHGDKKLWWVHCEAMYALVLGQEILGAPWCTEWYEKIHDWAFAHFDDPASGEWLQRLDRRGAITTETIALPVKDPFHWPRAIMLMIESFERRIAEPSERTAEPVPSFQG